MKIKNYSNLFTFENYLQLLVLSVPVLLITGPFLPDLFLSLAAVSFVILLIQIISYFALNKFLTLKS